MELNRKRVLFIASNNIITDNGEFADFHFHLDVLDKIERMNISHIAIVFPEGQHHVKVKAVEYFVFAYCKVAVSTHVMKDTLLDDVTGILQHNMRKRDMMLSVDIKIDGVDNISMEDFLR